MDTPPFDPSKAVRFDLVRGQVRHGDSAPDVLVPATTLVKLCELAGADATNAAGRALGEPIGRRVASRLRRTVGDARGASVEAFVDHLGGELTLAGVGSLGAERWGRALVLVVDHCPLGAGGDGLVASLLGAAISAATGTEARCLLLARDDVRARFLVTGAAGADKVSSWLGSGVSWGEALVRLHGPKATGEVA